MTQDVNDSAVAVLLLLLLLLLLLVSVVAAADWVFWVSQAVSKFVLHLLVAHEVPMIQGGANDSWVVPQPVRIPWVTQPASILVPWVSQAVSDQAPWASQAVSGYSVFLLHQIPWVVSGLVP